MAKKTPIKDQTLRNAEYFDTQRVKDDLYARALNGEKFDSLMDIVLSEENIREAYRNIKTNRGSLTPGTDGKTIADIRNLETDEVIQRVRKFVLGKQGYRPKPVRRKQIPKPNGTTRPLGIPCIWDRLIQQCIKQVLEPICEAHFSEHSYGFRPARSVENAMADVYKNLNLSRMIYVVEFDIKGFFDNVNHEKLIKQMWAMGIRDKRLIYIIKRILKAPIRLENGKTVIPDKGTPQGGIISPLLANIVLNELDRWIESQWEKNPILENYAMHIQSNGKVTYAGYHHLRRTTSLKEVRIVRYADDFRLFCKKEQDAEKIMYATKQWLHERLKLEISEEKTRIVDVTKQPMSFLGIEIKMTKKGKKYVVSSNVNPEQVKKIEKELKTLIKGIAKAKDSRDARNKIRLYNATVMGKQNYYRIATNVNLDFMKIEYQVKKTLETQLGNDKVKGGRLCRTGNLSSFEESRYGKSKMLRFDKMCGSPIYPIGYVQKKDPMFVRYGTTPYTPEGRAIIHEKLSFDTKLMIQLMKTPTRGSIELADNKISLFAAQWGKCGVTRKEFECTQEIHCHHKIPKEIGGDDSYSNLILVTETVHRVIHAKDESVIKRLIQEAGINKENIGTLNELRKMAGNEEIEL